MSVDFTENCLVLLSGVFLNLHPSPSSLNTKSCCCMCRFIILCWSQTQTLIFQHLFYFRCGSKMEPGGYCYSDKCSHIWALPTGTSVCACPSHVHVPASICAYLDGFLIFWAIFRRHSWAVSLLAELFPYFFLTFHLPVALCPPLPQALQPAEIKPLSCPGQGHFSRCLLTVLSVLCEFTSPGTHSVCADAVGCSTSWKEAAKKATGAECIWKWSNIWQTCR